MTKQNPFLQFHAAKTLYTAQGKQLLDIRFNLDKGSILAIYGPSGAGKTTLLRILAGLTTVTSGYIRLGEDTWLNTASRTNLPTRRRPIGFVFQDFALFPNLTVRQQLEYALPKGEDKILIDELLTLMELETLQGHRPALLSGGQQQRVALARAIARRPLLLLLDEPLSAVDDEMRNKLQEYILKIKQRYHLTTILVSHYLPEILRLADTAIILGHGRVTHQGRPAEIIARPTGTPLLQTGDKILRIEPAGDRFIINIDRSGTVFNLTLSPAETAALILA